MYFIHVPGLAELERQDDWEGCRKLLIDQLQKEPQSVPLLCRLIWECWYIVAEDGCLHTHEDVDYSTVMRTLRAAAEYGLEHYMENADFLWQVGFMMALFPFYFTDVDADVSKKRMFGRKMIRKAAELRRDDIVLQIIALGYERSPKQMSKIRERIGFQEIVRSKIGTETRMERYFRWMIGHIK